MRAPSAYQLHQEAAALFERIEALSLKAKGHSKATAKLLDQSADSLAGAMDILKKEVDRRRVLKEKYERDLRSGS